MALRPPMVLSAGASVPCQPLGDGEDSVPEAGGPARWRAARVGEGDNTAHHERAQTAKRNT